MRNITSPTPSPASTKIPRDRALDSTLAFLREGFTFLASRRRKYASDIFETRVLGRKAICIGGADAAKLFYDEDKMQRHGAVPLHVQNTLMGRNAIHTLDGAAHKHRKAIFLSLMTDANLRRLDGMMDMAWRSAARDWRGRGQVVLFQEAQRVICGVICAWAGVVVPTADVQKRAGDLAAMIDGFGGLGPRYVRARLARRRSERWLMKIVEDVRHGIYKAEEGTALFAVSWHHELNGHLLDPRMAAEELLNVLRPTVAISYYIAFAALALNEHPEYRDRIRKDPQALENFVQEVRRFYPFAPLLGAKVRKSFSWNGCPFPHKRLVLIDIYGTNHDANLWPDPEAFRPERFETQAITAYNYLPHGGGEVTGHRCPGEWITINTMKTIVKLLAETPYELPQQDLGFDLGRMPTYPRSGVIINVPSLRA